MRIILVLLLTVLAMFGCTTPSNPERIPLGLNDPEPITMLDYPITVYTIDGKAKICVSGEGYENMAKNTLELKRYIIQQREIIKSYKKYYEAPNENINN